MTGVIDFSETRFFDPVWRNRSRILLRGLHRENQRQLRLANLQRIVALFAINNLKPEAIENLQEQAIDLLRKVEDTYHPGSDAPQDKRDKTMMRQLSDKWEARFGKMSDPETQAKINKLSTGLLARQIDQVYDPLNINARRKSIAQEQRRVNRTSTVQFI